MLLRSLMSLAFVLLAAGYVRAQNVPARDGLEFSRMGVKNPESLAPKAGGPTERIEIQSTSDHIDYVVKAYTLREANSSEVYQLILNAVSLEGGSVDRIASGSRVRFNGHGEVEVDYEGGSILVVTAPEWMLPYLDQTIALLDQPNIEAAAFGTGYKYIRPKHRKPSDLVRLVGSSVASGVEVFVSDDSRNLLYLEDSPSFMGGILEAVEAFDRPPDQVEARIRIFEIDETRSHDVGLDWHAFQKSVTDGSLDFVWGEAGQAGLSLESLTSSLSFNALLATEFLNYQSREGNARVVTDTVIRVVNGETATVESVLEIPYVLRGFVDNDVIDSPRRDSPEALDPDRLIKEFVEGVVITITPTIGTESMELEIEAAVSSHVGYTPNQSVPIMTRSLVQSVLDISSGRPAVLGGLTRTTTIDERSGVPWLKDIPGVRYLFSREIQRRHKSHIVISIEPRNPVQAECDPGGVTRN